MMNYMMSYQIAAKHGRNATHLAGTKMHRITYKVTKNGLNVPLSLAPGIGTRFSASTRTADQENPGGFFTVQPENSRVVPVEKLRAVSPIFSGCSVTVEPENRMPIPA